MNYCATAPNVIIIVTTIIGNIHTDVLGVSRRIRDAHSSLYFDMATAEESAYRQK